MVGLKRCTKCGAEHPPTLEFFSPNRHVKSGLNSWCRDCMRAKNRETCRRRYASKRQMAAEEILDAKVPDARVEFVPLKNGLRGVRFGKAWRPAHPEADTRALRGFASPLASIFA